MSSRFRKLSLSKFSFFRLMDGVLTQTTAPLVEHSQSLFCRQTDAVIRGSS